VVYPLYGGLMGTTRFFTLRGDTASGWTTKNPVLAQGEIGFETDTAQMKVGNGTTAWTSLAYFTVEGAGGVIYTQEEKDKLAGLSSDSSDTFIMHGHCYVFDPADSTTYYFGSIYSGPPTTTAGRRRIVSPYPGTMYIRSVSIFADNNTSNGSDETSTLYIRKNNTTDYTLTTVLQNDQTSEVFACSGLNIPFSQYEYFEFKWVTPAWATNPSGTRFSIAIWCDCKAPTVETAPTVTSLTATSVGSTTATLNGNLTSLGTASTVGCDFEYGTTDSYGSTSFEGYAGSEATDRAASGSTAGYTDIDLASPITATGWITQVEVWMRVSATNLRVGTFYLDSGTTYICRDSAALGAVTAGSKVTQTTDSGGDPLRIVCQSGDYIGWYDVDGSIEYDTTGGSGWMYFNGERIDPADTASFSSASNYAGSCRGAYIVTKTSAGTFSDSLTGLSTSTLYHFRARAQGDATAYGSDLTFTTGAGDPTPPTYYGTGAYTGSDPIGGGIGYTDIYTTGDHVITSTADFLAHMKGGASEATSGQVVFIPSTINNGQGIDLTSTVTSNSTTVIVPDGVILASDRGSGSNPGALIYHTGYVNGAWLRFINCLQLEAGNAGRITGLRLRGPDATIGKSDTAPFMRGIYATGATGWDVDNCEIYNWPGGGILWYSDTAVASDGTVTTANRGHIHHNYIHNCRRAGYGYGVQLYASAALIECNNFNACRHFVSGERNGNWTPEGHYTAEGGSETTAPTNGEEVYGTIHYNVFGWGTSPECSNTQVDQHGGSDTYLYFDHPDHEWGDRWGPYPEFAGLPDVWAGGEWEIKWNDFCVLGQTCVSIRGIPRFTWTVTYNWFKSCLQTQQYTLGVKQRLYTLTNSPGVASPYLSDAPPYVAESGEAITVSNNWWGTTAPPEA
jgi:hypothetical protein